MNYLKTTSGSFGMCHSISIGVDVMLYCRKFCQLINSVFLWNLNRKTLYSATNVESGPLSTTHQGDPVNNLAKQRLDDPMGTWKPRAEASNSFLVKDGLETSLHTFCRWPKYLWRYAFDSVCASGGMHGKSSTFAPQMSISNHSRRREWNAAVLWMPSWTYGKTWGCGHEKTGFVFAASPAQKLHPSVLSWNVATNYG